MSFWKKLFGKSANKNPNDSGLDQQESKVSDLDQQETVTLQGIIRVWKQEVDGAIMGRPGQKIVRKRLQLVTTNENKEKEEIFDLSPPTVKVNAPEGVTWKVLDRDKWAKDIQALEKLEGKTVQLIGWLDINEDEKDIMVKSFKELIQETNQPSMAHSSPEIILQGDNDPLINIDTQTISYAFITLTSNDLQHSEFATDLIGKINRRCQPRVWDEPFSAKFVTFTVDASENGFPDPSAVRPALESQGLVPPYSLIINTATVTFDQGKSQSNILLGFSYREPKERIVLARTDGCLPI